MIHGQYLLLEANLTENTLPLGLDLLICWLAAAQFGNGMKAVLVSTAHGQPAWAEWKEMDADSDHKSRYHLKTEGKSKGDLSGELLRTICDPVGDDSADDNTTSG